MTGRWFAMIGLVAGCGYLPDDVEGTDTPSGTTITIGTATTPGVLVPPASIAGESSYCWFVAPVNPNGHSRAALGLFAVGMDSGAIESIGAYGDVYELFHTAGIAYTGSSLVMSGYNGNDFDWYELDLTTGAVNHGAADVYGDGVTALGTGELVLYDSSLVPGDVYPDFGALTSGAPTAQLPALNKGLFSRYQIAGDEVYTAWHSTDEVQVFDVANGDLLDTIRLDHYDTWVWGVGVAADMVHLIDDGRGNHPNGSVWISRFDATGALVSEVDLGAVATTLWPSGLYCAAP